MSLNTLLEAAKFLEQQEQQQRQQQAKITVVPTGTTVVTTAPAIMSEKQQQQQQNGGLFKTTHIPTTVLITSSELTPSLLTLAQQTIKSANEQQQRAANANAPTPPPTTAPRRVFNNSFDIIDPLANRAPLAFRSGTREVHNKLEKHRRAQLKECFDVLKKQLPATPDEKKTSNLNILHSALRCIQSLKRKERELEHEMERLARDKIAAQNKLAVLKKDIVSHYDNVDFAKILPEAVVIHQNGTSTTTTTTTTATTINSSNNSSSSTSSEENNGEQQQQQQQQRIQIPLLPATSASKTPQLSIATAGTLKEGGNNGGQPVQTTALSVLPMGYPVSQGLVLQKLAIVPTKGLSELAPLVSTHFITQQHGKVVPLVNAQYVVKPVVVVSRPS